MIQTFDSITYRLVTWNSIPSCLCRGNVAAKLGQRTQGTRGSALCSRSSVLRKLVSLTVLTPGLCGCHAGTLNTNTGLAKTIFHHSGNGVEKPWNIRVCCQDGACWGPTSTQGHQFLCDPVILLVPSFSLFFSYSFFYLFFYIVIHVTF